MLKKISVNGGEPIILAETTDSPHGASFRAETPVEVLAGNLLPISGISRRYDLARDCRVIAVLERDQQEASEPPRTIIVLNWFEELKQRSR